MRGLPSIIVALCFVLVPLTASANTITVTSLVGPDPTGTECTLDEALTQASGGAASPECAPTGPAGPLVVQLPAGTGTYTTSPGSGVAWPRLHGTFTIRGAGAAMTTLHDGSPDPLRLAETDAGAVITIEALGVDGFRGADHGGTVVYARENTQLTIRNCTFHDNSNTYFGGVIQMFLSGTTTSLTVEGSTFDGNSAVRGGAIESEEGIVSITGSTFTGNSSDSGDSLWIVSSVAAQTTTISASTFDGAHIAGGSYGTVGIRGPGAVTVSDSMFTAGVGFDGGAFFAESPVVLTNDTFTDNDAINPGGAVHVGGTDPAMISDCTFRGNHADENGGALFCDVACTVQRCRFESNDAGVGGAIDANAVLTVVDSVFIGNVAAVTAITNVATDDSATEGGDTGTFTVGRVMASSAILAQQGGTVTGSCFVAGVRPIVEAHTVALTATGNFWTTTDLGIRAAGPVDTSGALATAPAGCDPAAVATLGAQLLTSSVSGSATPDVDYDALPSPLAFTPGRSDIVLTVTALPDAVADPAESIDLDVDFMGAGELATVRIVDAQPANLVITKTVDRPTALVGEDLTFTLTLHNDGPGEAENIVVTDALPSGLALTDAHIVVPAGITAACIPGPPASCTIASLALDATATVTVVVHVTGVGDITNRADVTSASDPDPSSDFSTVNVTLEMPDAGAPDAGAGVDAGPGADAGPLTDAGPRADASGLDASHLADGGAITTASGGCCNAAGTSGGRLAPMLGLALLALVTSRRRRGARS